MDAVEIGKPIHDTRTRSDDILSWLMSYMLSRLVTHSSVHRDVSIRWDEFCVSRSPRFVPYCSLAKARHRPSSSADIADLRHTDGELSQEWSVAARSLVSPDGAEEGLRLLLEYLHVEFGHSVVIVVDGLDHAEPQVQAEIALALSRVVRSTDSTSSAIFAIRNENYPQLEERLETAGGFHSLSIEASELEDGGESLVRQFLRTRLQAVLDCRQKICELKAEELDIEQFTSVSEEWYALLNAFMDEALDTDHEHVLLSKLSRWHNNSLRAIGTTILRMLEDALTNGHELSDYDDIAAVMRARKGTRTNSAAEQLRRSRNRTLMRTHLYRKFVFSQPTVGNSTRVPSALPLHALRRNKRNSEINFPKMRVLSLLRSRQATGTGVTLHDVRTAFETFDTAADVADGAVQQLASRRYSGDTGLVATSRKVVAGCTEAAARETSLFLQPAGDYLISSLCTTTEYVFWCAANNPHATDCFTQAKEYDWLEGEDLLIPFSFISDYGYRLRVAALYLDWHILPRYQSEMPLPTERSSSEERDRLAARAHDFLEVFRGQFPQSIAGNITGFAGRLLVEGRATEEDKDWAATRVAETNRYCRRVEQLANG